VDLVEAAGETGATCSADGGGVVGSAGACKLEPGVDGDGAAGTAADVGVAAPGVVPEVASVDAWTVEVGDVDTRMTSDDDEDVAAVAPRASVDA
jgi:hypothetical protein